MGLYNKFAVTCVSTIKAIRLSIISLFKIILFYSPSESKKILINRDGAFGDSVVVVPALSIIRQHFPDSQIDLISVADGGISIGNIGLEPGIIDNFYIIKKDQRRETLAKLKHNQYDYFIQMPQNIGLYKSIRNMILVRFYLNIKSAIGWDHGRIKIFMRQQKMFMDTPNETQRFITNLEKEGIKGKVNYPLTTKKPDNSKINNLLDHDKLIAFIIGGKIQPKKWPLDYWVRLATLIGNEHMILIIGGEAEYEEANHICAITNNTNNLCGKLAIPELTYVLEQVNLAISLDTGARHLCDAVNTKSIVLLSTRELTNKWFPTNRDSIIIEKVLPCSFCLKTRCENNLCMTTILPEEVYDKASKLLAN